MRERLLPGHLRRIYHPPASAGMEMQIIFHRIQHDNGLFVVTCEPIVKMTAIIAGKTQWSVSTGGKRTIIIQDGVINHEYKKTLAGDSDLSYLTLIPYIADELFRPVEEELLSIYEKIIAVNPS